MPGHLTYEDRRRIAEWLVEGLAYAEIARRLARSRSTIGREIARNGGPHAYRADRAQQATGRRARRRTPSQHPVTHAVDNAYGRDPESVREFEERFRAMMVLTGLAPMPARVLTCLFLSDAGSFTAAELVERLRVSPASISKAVGYLEPLGLVRRERDNRRRERYLIDDDVWYRAWSASSRSVAMWADEARHGADVLGAATPAGVRLRTTSQFFDFVGQDMAQAAEHWRQTLSPAAEGGVVSAGRNGRPVS
jgi:predicted transcriptional regulator